MQKEKRKICSTIVGIFLCLIILTVGQNGIYLLQQFAHNSFGNLLSAVFYIGVVLLLLNILFKKIRGESLRECDMFHFHIQRKWLVIGLVLLICALGISVMQAGVWLRNSFSTSEVAYRITYQIFVVSLGGAIVEEFIFRGVMLEIIKARWNKLSAVLIPALVFPLGHLTYAKDGLDIVLVFFAGFTVSCMFSVIYLESHSIWNNILIHGIWNVFMVPGIFSFQEKASTDVLLSYIISNKSRWMTGGSFGMEASIANVLLYVGVIMLGLYFMKKQEK